MEGFYKLNPGGKQGCSYLVYGRNLETIKELINN
jgi:hypothetical protein